MMRRGELMRRATYASVAVAFTLIVTKAAAWALTDSVAVLSSLLDSLLDVAASLLNLVAVRHALTPPDREHRFGHGKAEPLAGLAQGAFITGSALLIAVEAAHRFAAPRPPAHPEIGVGVMVLSMALTLALVFYQRRVIRLTGSTAISADALHYGGDILMNGSVILSLALSAWLGLPDLDPLFGLAIAGYILYSVWRIVAVSLDRLMDRELPEADRVRIRTLVLRHPDVRSVHDLRTRSSGSDVFIQLHLEMDGKLPLSRAHEIADQVELEVQAAYPTAEITIHQEPVGLGPMHDHPAQPAGPVS